MGRGARPWIKTQWPLATQSHEEEKHQEEDLPQRPSDVESAHERLPGTTEEHRHPEVSKCSIRGVQLRAGEQEALQNAEGTEDQPLQKPSELRLLPDHAGGVDGALQPMCRREGRQQQEPRLQRYGTPLCLWAIAHHHAEGAAAAIAYAVTAIGDHLLCSIEHNPSVPEVALHEPCRSPGKAQSAHGVLGKGDAEGNPCSEGRCVGRLIAQR
mmetsp:Transcript_34823/g.75944  ORF Transcript_34823/g.75944 Transcript_34823/m.75944 type:complete len:212 (+) Transcript_34823:37-672(+)